MPPALATVPCLRQQLLSSLLGLRPLGVLLGLLIGYVSLRLRGVYFAIFTLAMVWERVCLFASHVGTMERILQETIEHARSRCALRVWVEDGHLVIRGERKQEGELKEESYYRLETAYGTFERFIPLPEGFEEGEIEAADRMSAVGELRREFNAAAVVPLHAAFVPFVAEAILYAANAGESSRAYLVAEAPAGAKPEPGVYLPFVSKGFPACAKKFRRFIPSGGGSPRCRAHTAPA